MSYSVRHQIFVSSTFTDLKEERAEVIQAVWELDCIPTGMEAFVASNESQWDVIKRVIDECDYYVLIIGGRYGSLAAEGISYTEKEYRYARKIGLPVLAFVHGAPDDIPLGRSEQDDQLRAKLHAFRDEVMKTYPIREWRTASELGSVVSRSLVREIKRTPRPGWIRNDGTSPIALLEQINQLTEENRALRDTVAVQAPALDGTLASGADMLILLGERTIRDKSSRISRADDWKTQASYDDIFRDIGPALLSEASEQELKGILARYQSWDIIPPDTHLVDNPVPFIFHEVWSAVLIQFRALGFMVPGTKKRTVSDKNSYWKITPAGDAHLLSLLAVRRASVETDDDLPA